MIETLPLAQWPLAPLFESTLGFVTVMVFIAGGIGVAGKNLAVGAMGAYMMFLYYALNVDHPLLNNLMYLTIVIIPLGVAFKFWRLEGGGQTGT